jgi:tetratricopeptide (TPR) repeat protein
VTNLRGENKKIALFYKAESYFLQRKLGEAWQIFFVIRRLYPDFWQAQFRKGCIHVLQQEYQKGKKILNGIQKGFPLVYFWKGRLYEGLNETDRAIEFYQKDLANPEAVFRAARLLERKKEDETALSYYSLLYEKYPGYRNRALKSLVRIHEARNEYSAMLKYLKEWEKVEPQNIEIQKKMGLALYHLNQIEKSYQILSTTAAYKRDAAILKILGRISFRLEKYDRAVRYLGQVKMNREETKLYVQALMKMEQYGVAKMELMNLVQKKKGDRKERARFYSWLVECNLQLGNTEEALKYAKLMVQMEETAGNYLTLAQVYQYSKNRAGYISSMKKAAEMEPRYVPMLLKKLIELKDYEQALGIIRNILQKDPYHEQALFYRAKIEIQQKRWDDARISLYTLVYLPPKDQKIYKKSLYYLASIRLYDGKTAEARSLLKKGLEIAPNSIELNFRMADILIREKKYREARKILNRVKARDTLSGKFRIRVYELLAFVEKELNNFDQSKHYAARVKELKVGETP